MKKMIAAVLAVVGISSVYADVNDSFKLGKAVEDTDTPPEFRLVAENTKKRPGCRLKFCRLTLTSDSETFADLAIGRGVALELDCDTRDHFCRMS
ncbi:hypothetical protein [Spartinivicinus poritis]|uniref:Uncharacterized protein n=1 Tax=Spartinivicinus poritis TaxID=2994640 RepID=A0ABT5UG05_9GAMM|nr:hypothetical protein [Spartinivicinus sp. A2-2]MDE1465318.1 hypothetical protein [Spartinivicinus sp. A2-2]